MNWNSRNRAEAVIINGMAHRATAMAQSVGIEYKVMDADMDLTACHLNGCPLRLEDMAKADDFNFAHDVLGIRRHLNRETGQLEDCFVPRFAI
jgi:hypothetical protein